MGGEAKIARVFAVVLSWNLRERVLEVLGALQAEDALEGLILVDNGSVDGAPDAAREAFPEVEVIENGRNLGYAGGNNVGLRRAMEKNADYVLLLNSDALPTEGAVKRLIQAAVEEKAGAVGGKPVRRDNPAILDAAWGVINWRNMASRLEGKGAPDGHRFSARRSVDYPLGVALILSVEALREVGLFDEDYFAYHEEMELCERIRRAGWPVLFEPAKFLHGGSESLKKARAELAREYLLARNSVRFVEKYAGVSQKVKFWFFVLAASILKMPVEIATGRTKAHFARIRGWMDGLMQKNRDTRLFPCKH